MQFKVVNTKLKKAILVNFKMHKYLVKMFFLNKALYMQLSIGKVQCPKIMSICMTVFLYLCIQQLNYFEKNIN